MKNPMYKHDNAIITECANIVTLKKMLEVPPFKDKDMENLYNKLLYCHVVSILDTYIGSITRFQLYQNGEKIKEDKPYQNPEIINNALKEKLNISIEIPIALSEATTKRNYIIHRCGIDKYGKKIIIRRSNVRKLYYVLKEFISKINEAKLCKVADALQ